jgi:hypothetical protein
MNIKQAIEAIAAFETITGFNAEMVLKDNKKMKSFCQMIYDQYNRDGNKEHLQEMYGQEVIETVISYGVDNNLIIKISEI